MKYIFITGGAGGLGYATAKELAQADWTVFIGDLNFDNLKIEKDENIIPVLLDVTSIESITKAMETVKKRTDHLDAVMNFAGIIFMDSLIEGDISRMSRLIDINLMGMIRVNQVFFPLINKCKGRIINISSENGWLKPAPFNGIYSMSKYAVEAYNDALRRELNFLGVKVIKMQLGSFKTNMHNSTVDSFKALRKKTNYYKQELKSMGTLMNKELEESNDIKYLIKAVRHALYDDDPKYNYRVKNSKRLIMFNLLPERWVDYLYKDILS